MTTLSERVRLAMEQAGLDQVALARACRITPVSVNDWLSGKTKSLKAEPAIDAAEALKVNPRWLACGKGPQSPDRNQSLTDQETSLLDAYRRLPAGWAYYLRRKADELATIADSLPEFLFEACKVIPENGQYADWEARLDALVDDRRGSVTRANDRAHHPPQEQ